MLTPPPPPSQRTDQSPPPPSIFNVNYISRGGLGGGHPGRRPRFRQEKCIPPRPRGWETACPHFLCLGRRLSARLSLPPQGSPAPQMAILRAPSPRGGGRRPSPLQLPIPAGPTLSPHDLGDMLGTGHRHALGHVHALLARLAVVQRGALVTVQPQEGELVQRELQGSLVIQSLAPAATPTAASPSAAVALQVCKQRAGHRSAVRTAPPPALGSAARSCGHKGSREASGQGRGGRPATEGSVAPFSVPGGAGRSVRSAPGSGCGRPRLDPHPRSAGGWGGGRARAAAARAPRVPGWLATMPSKKRAGERQQRFFKEPLPSSSTPSRPPARPPSLSAFSSSAPRLKTEPLQPDGSGGGRGRRNVTGGS